MAFQLDPTLYQRYQPQPLQLPNMLPALQQFSQLRDMRDARRLRTREEKKSQKLNELYGQTGGDLREMARQYGPIDAKTGFELTNMANTKDKQIAEAQKQAFEMKQKKMGLISNVANKYINLDPQKKIEGFNGLREFMRSNAIPEPPSWAGKTEYDQEIEATLMPLAQMGQAGQQAFAPTKYQSRVDRDLNYVNFNPSDGSYTRAVDETGAPIQAPESYTYREDESGGMVPFSTKRPPTQAPQPVQGFKPAGAKKLKLETIRASANLKKAELDLKTAQTLAKQGGQFKTTQYEASGYGIRMAETEQVLESLSREKYDPTTIRNAVLSKNLEAFKSGPIKRYAQAQKSFINATLRRESGAAIAQSEFDNAEEQYFPQIGDSSKILAQKKANRQVVQGMMMAEAGGAWNEVLGALSKIRKPVKSSSTKVIPQSNKPSKEDSQLMEQYGF